MSAPSLSLAKAPAVRGRWTRRNAWPLAVYALLVVLLGVEKIVHPALNNYDMQSLVGGALPLALAAMAQAVVVISGGVDLSVGALMSLVNVVSAFYMVHADLKGALLVSALLVAGTALAGALTGLIITATRVPDIIVTLATSFVWSGLALQVMPTPGGGAPQEFADLLTGEVAAVAPAGVVALLVVVAVVWLPLRRASRAGPLRHRQQPHRRLFERRQRGAGARRRVRVWGCLRRAGRPRADREHAQRQRHLGHRRGRLHPEQRRGRRRRRG